MLGQDSRRHRGRYLLIQGYLKGNLTVAVCPQPGLALSFFLQVLRVFKRFREGSVILHRDFNEVMNSALNGAAWWKVVGRTVIERLVHFLKEQEPNDI